MGAAVRFASPRQRPAISTGSSSAGLGRWEGPPSGVPGGLSTLTTAGDRGRSQLNRLGSSRNNDPVGAREVSASADAARHPGAIDLPAAAVGPLEGRALVIGCGALARELLEVTARIPCLSPDLHNRPGGIPGAVRKRIAQARRDGFERIFVAYADCGTGGLLEPVLAEAGVERLPGAHCYEVFAGSAEFAALADAEPGTFWLTDFLARNFERLVIRGLGIDRHPELQATYFAHYTRVVFLSQTDDPDLLVFARRAADRLGLAFEHRPVGVANLAAPILDFAARAARGAAH
jgi:Protein of unknown function (DUF1638)